jgi:hypothetical protein
LGRTHSTLTVLAVMAAVLLGSSESAAEPPKTSSSPSAVDACTFSGSTKLGADVAIYDQPQGGRPIARFTGGSTALRAGPVPLDVAQRVPVATGTGTGSFRIEGFVDTLEVPIFTTREVPVVPGHLWIGAQQAVVLVGGAAGKVHVRKDLGRPLSQSFKAWAACDQLSLAHTSPPGWSPPGEARGFLVQEDPADLFGEPSATGAPLTSLIGARGMLLWSEERRGAFVHLVYHGEVVIDAWGRQRDFRALPPGETSDRLAAATAVPNPPSLKLAESPRIVKTTRETKIRSAANATGSVIGKIEVGTETFVLDIVAGWASVLPKQLNVAPYGDGQFWVKASELGL